MWERAKRRLPTRVVNDQWGRPTGTEDLAIAVWDLLRSGASGLVHVTNAGAPVTWYEFAKRIYSVVGANDLLLPCSTAEYPTAAKRPAFSALGTARLEQWLGRTMPDWTDASDHFLKHLAATVSPGA
jgi:dTDP-4-dehydrorhamnose reductase